MNRLSLAAAAIAIVLIVGGGAFVTDPEQLDRRGTHTNGISPLYRQARPSPRPTPIRAATWIADAMPITGWAHRSEDPVRLDATGKLLTIHAGAAGSNLESAVVAAGTDELGLLTTKDAAGCVTGDLGRYRSTATADGVTLTFTAISDPCATRSAALARELDPIARPWEQGRSAVSSRRSIPRSS